MSIFHRSKFFPAIIVATIICAFANVSSADDAIKEAAETVSETTTESANNAISTLKSAFQGDAEAITELATKYAVPAAVALVLLFIGYLVASFLGRIIGNAVAKKVDATLGKFLCKAIKNLIMVMVILGSLGYFGVDVTSFAAILAAVGFAVGMALQGTLANFAAGMMLLVFRPFKVDDYIVVAGTQGTVEEIDLFTTRLNSLDNRHLIIPNSQIFGNLLENYSHNDVRRVDVNVGADYSADLRKTRAVLESVVEQVQGSTEEPAPQVYLHELGSSSVDWQLRVWCPHADYWDVREKLMNAAKEAMDRNGISIPFPQMDIHVSGKSLVKAA